MTLVAATDRITTSVGADDGCGLATDVFLPASGALPAPAVLLRTPYGRLSRSRAWLALVEAGYALVVQDLRGRGGSGGAFLTGADETDDGRRALGWVTAQPWCDGRVVCAGMGYEAPAAWAAAACGDHPVAAVVSQQPWAPAATSGPFLLEDLLRWHVDHGPSGPSGAGGVAAVADGLRRLLLSGPLDELGRRWPGGLADWPPRVPEAGDATGLVRTAQAPSLHLGSWFCSSAATTLAQAAAAGAGLATVVVGPWVSAITHRLAPYCVLAIDDDQVPDPAGLVLRWLDKVLRGQGPGIAPRTFLLAGHRWVDVDPMAAAVRPATGTWQGGPDHALVPVEGVGPAPRARMAVLVHDPADPVASGRHSDDYRPFVSRPDVLRWSTARLGAPLCWFGRARCHLVVEAPRQGCDVVVTLLHERPDGRRARLLDAATELGAGQRHVDVELPPAAVEIPIGSRLHVEVSTSRFPRFARGLAGADRWAAGGAEPVTILLGPSADGLLHLPAMVWPAGPTSAPADTGDDVVDLDPSRPLARLVDGRTGVVTQVAPVPTSPGAPPWLHLHAASVADVGAHLPWPADRISTGMSAGDPDRAWTCAVGEAVERYCGNFVPAGLRQASYDELLASGVAAVDPEALALYSPGQYATAGFPFRPFSRQLAVRWVEGRSLVDGRDLLVPASLVYVNYHVGREEPLTNFVNLAGIAAGPTRRAAEASAMEELIERDATMIWWYNGLPARPVDVGHPRLGHLLSPLAEVGPGWGVAAGVDSAWRYRVVALPTTLAVAVMGVLVHDPAEGIVGLGVAARPDPADAVAKAFAEAVSLHLYAKGLLDPDGDIWQLAAAGTIDGSVLKAHRADRRYLDDYRRDWRDVLDLGCHSQVWLDERLHHALGPIVGGNDVVELDELPHLTGDPWELYRDRLLGQGLHACSVEVTTPDVAAAGAAVVRVVAPGAYSNPPAAFPFLGGRRLYDDPVSLGLRPEPASEESMVLVPLPHT